MKKFCNKEAGIIQALLKGKLDPGQNQHLKECVHCRESFRVFHWMHSIKEKTQQSSANVLKNLPDPQLLIDQASYRKPPDPGLVKKALKPLDYPKFLLFFLLSVVVVVLIFSPGFTSQIKNMVSNYAGSSLAQSTFFHRLKQMLPFLLTPVLTLLAFYLIVAFSAFRAGRKKET